MLSVDDVRSVVVVLLMASEQFVSAERFLFLGADRVRMHSVLVEPYISVVSFVFGEPHGYGALVLEEPFVLRCRAWRRCRSWAWGRSCPWTW